MPLFRYTFIKPATGRKNSGKRYAYDEAELRAVFAEEGIEAADIAVVPEDPATDRQLEYLRDLGVAVQDGLDKREASDLITNAQARHSPMGSAERHIAHYFRIEVTRFTSKATLHRMICDATMADGRIGEWFVYRVYRSEFDRSKIGIETPGDLRLVSIAARLQHDGKAWSSLMQTAKTSSTGFRWFGEFTSSDGGVHIGDSRRTACFLFVISELRNAGLVPQRKPASTFPIGTQSPPASARARQKVERIENTSPLTQPLSQKSGCLGVLGAIVVAPLMVLLFYSSR